MCHEIDHGSLIKTTGSSNHGHAVCCKPDYDGEHCTTGTEHICSQPVGLEYTIPEFKPILTNNAIN